MLRSGLSRRQIKVRADRGTLIRQYRGVYRLGHAAPSVEADYLAAVLACGEGALLCGKPAAYLWKLVFGEAPAPEAATLGERRVPGVLTRRRKVLQGVYRHGVPVVSVPETLVDLAAVFTPPAMARACHEAGVRYRTTPRQVEAVLSRRPNTPGARALRTVMSGSVPVTASVLERRFLFLLRRHGLPPPETNRPAGTFRVDCRWPAHAVTVELDSYRFHNTRQAWERDRRREREAHARGDEFRRYTYGDVLDEPASLLAELSALLGPDAP